MKIFFSFNFVIIGTRRQPHNNIYEANDSDDTRDTRELRFLKLHL